MGMIICIIRIWLYTVCIILIAFSGITPSVAYENDASLFIVAKPVWLADRELEMNLTVGFVADFARPEGSCAILRITGSSIYRVFLNGVFVGYGPARGPKNYYRIDEWKLDQMRIEDRNTVAVEVAGYNINSYYLLDQPSFIQAEIISDGVVLAATGSLNNSFTAVQPDERVQKVERYSFQRLFMEWYRLRPGYDAWRTGNEVEAISVPLVVQSAKTLLPRRVPYPDFHMRQPIAQIGSGIMRQIEPPAEPWRVVQSRSIGPTFKGFRDDELEGLPAVDLQAYANATREDTFTPYNPLAPLAMSAEVYRMFDLGTNLTGFLGVTIRCETQVRLLLTFDELLTGGDVDYRRMWCNNIIELDCAPGVYHFESMEPYTLRYLKLIALDGNCEVNGITLREYAAPDVDEARFASADPKLNDIFEAARETYRQNAVDLFTDCPSRERAGWLCDSYFTARVAMDLSGHTAVEKAFLENFLLPQSFQYIPQGMLPSCYPADHPDGMFIPNWALFFVLELEEYYARNGDQDMVAAFEPRVNALFEYFRPFENESGLLENLENWVFVEWSEANNYVQDVNYPTNALYAGALDAAARLYNRADLATKADTVRKTIRKQALKSAFFVDNAVRDNGALTVTTNTTEVCQYYSFFFDVASPETDPDLWNKLLNDFGPWRDTRKIYPEVAKANAFIGNYLRLELLSRYGHCRRIKEEIIGYFHGMAKTTGTLWEHMDTTGSCNHGFASHVAHCLYRDVLGIYRVDTVLKKVTLRFVDVDLQWCNGSIPVAEGVVSLAWQRDGGTIRYRAVVPTGYTLEIINTDGLQIDAN